MFFMGTAIIPIVFLVSGRCQKVSYT
jgi:hypothetical protein